ncbi:hypothetical protein [Allosphingosinicella sp.]|uniref:hypothetical protein n=1 Tax=Allosphingosinicella sp. TaxID=2823234 RepID=UPI002FC13D54
MTECDGLLRAQALEAYEAVPSLDAHGELTRLILAEVALLTRKYRCVRRHDVPHIAELTGLLDVFWQEVQMAEAQEAEMPTIPPPQAQAIAFPPAG